MEKNKEAGFLNVSQGRSKSIPSVETSRDTVCWEISTIQLHCWVHMTLPINIVHVTQFVQYIAKQQGLGPIPGNFPPPPAKHRSKHITIPLL